MTNFNPKLFPAWVVERILVVFSTLLFLVSQFSSFVPNFLHFLGGGHAKTFMLVAVTTLTTLTITTRLQLYNSTVSQLHFDSLCHFIKLSSDIFTFFALTFYKSFTFIQKITFIHQVSEKFYIYSKESTYFYSYIKMNKLHEVCAFFPCNRLIATKSQTIYHPGSLLATRGFRTDQLLDLLRKAAPISTL